MKLSPVLRASALALAAALVCAPAARSDAAKQPTFSADSTTIKAGDDLNWNVNISVLNALDVGLYLDSLSCEIEELGATGPPRHATVSLDALVQNALTAGQGYTIEHMTPVICERARLTFRLRAHDAAGTVYRMSTAVTAEPGDYSIAHPSELIAARGKKVEIVTIPAVGTTGRAPGMMLVPPEGGVARELLRTGRLLSKNGFHVVLVSMPGYGQSEGPADLAGPATIAALDAAFERLKNMPGVDASKLGAWGISRGATAVASLATRRPDLAIAVAQSGLYDLWAGYRAAGAPGRNEIVAQAGRDSAAWRERSPISRAGSVKGTVFVLHGERDPDAPAAQAHAFVEALQKAGANAEGKFFPLAEHSLPRGDAQRAILAFLHQHFGM